MATTSTTNGTTVENLNVLDTSKSNDAGGVEIITWSEVSSALFQTSNATQSQTIATAFKAGNLKLTFAVTDGGPYYTVWVEPGTTGPIYHLAHSNEFGALSEDGGSFTSLSLFQTAANVLTGSQLVTADIDGGMGKDNIQGISNNASIHNIIQGGAGADVMSGGLGSDFFVYKATTDSPVQGQLNPGGQLAQTWDVITNFSSSQGDKIDFTAFAGTSGLMWGGGAAISGKPSVWYTSDGSGGIYLYADTDGVGGADLKIQLSNLTSISASDILGVNGKASAVILSNPITSTAENGEAKKVADIALSDDGLGANVLSLSGADASAFEIRDGHNGKELWFNGGANFEAKSSYAVNVDVNDETAAYHSGNSPDASTAFHLAISDVNEAPTAVVLSNPVTSTAENGAAVKVSDIAVTDDALGANALSLSGTDSGSFEIRDGAHGKELWFTGGADFEAKAAYDVTVSAADGAVAGSTPVTADFHLAISDVNEAPTAVVLSNPVTSTAENGAAVKVSDIAVTDDALGANALSLSGTDSGSFEIRDGAHGKELWFTGGADFEAKAAYDVTVSAADGAVAGSTPVTADFHLAISDVNEAPTAVVLSNPVTSTAENGAAVKVSDIAVTDDALGANALSLSGTDSGSFEIRDGAHGKELWFTGGADFEAKAAYDVTVSAADGAVAGSTPVTADFHLAISDVNEAPTAVVLSNPVTSTAENGAAVKVSDIAVTDDALGANALSLSGTDSGSFEIRDGAHGKELWFTGGADFEAKAAYDVTVSAADGAVAGSTPVTADFHLAISDVNEAPTAVVLSNPVTSTAENGAAVKVSDIAVTDDALGANALSLSGTDSGSFEIRDGAHGKELWFTGGADFEAKAAYDVTVSAADGAVAGSTPVTADFHLAISDVNEAPTAVVLSNPVTSTAENGAAVKVSDIAVTDDALGANALSLSGTDSGSFEIRDGAHGKELWFTGGADFEAKAAYDVTVSAADGAVAGSTPVTADFHLAISDVNEAPTAVVLSNPVTSTAENGAAVKVSDIAVTDDALGANALSLSGTDSGSFEIRDGAHGKELWFTGGADFEAKAAYDVTVSAADGAVAGSTPVTADFHLAISDVNEAPTAVVLSNPVTSTAENGAAVKVSDIAVTDDALGANALSLSGTDSGSFEIRDGAHGKELWFTGGADFEAKAAYDVTVSAADGAVAGSTPVTADFHLAISDVNEAPTAVVLSNPVTSTAENGAAVKVSDIAVTDDALGANALSLSGTDSGSFEIRDGAHGKELWFTGGADFEAKAAYDVTVSAADGAVAGSTPVTADFHLAISDVNEAPTAVVLSNPVTSTAENGAAVKVSDIAVTDDALGANALSLSGTDSGSFEIRDGAHGKELWFTGGADFEAKAAYDVTVSAADGAVAGSTPVTADFHLAISDVNEAPTAVVLSNPVTSTAENGAAVKVSDIAVTDDALGANALSLSGTDSGSFEIRDGAHGKELWFKGGADFETKASYSVTVNADDAAASNHVTTGHDASRNFTLVITDVVEDVTPPTVTSITATNGKPNVTFTVTFSEAVTGVTLDDFVLTGNAGSASGSSVTGVTGSGTTYVVTATYAPGQSSGGSFGLNLKSGTDVKDAAGNVALASTFSAQIAHLAPAGVAGEAINLGLTHPAGDGEPVTIIIADAPADWVFSSGERKADGSWVVTTSDPASLTVTTSATFAGAAVLNMTQSWTGADGAAMTNVIANNVEAYAPGTPIFAWSGDDNLTGSSGADTFVFADPIGADNLFNFDVAQDKIDLIGFTGFKSFADVQAHLTEDASGDALLTLGAGESIKFEGVHAADLTSDNFVFDQEPVVNNTGTMTIGDGAMLPLSGAVHNTGTIELNSAGSQTLLQLIEHGVTLDGSGIVLMSDNDGNVIAGTKAGITLTNHDNTISGAGQIGQGQLIFVNEADAKVIADGTHALVIDTGANAVHNAGLLEATGSGGLVVKSDLVNAGTLAAHGGDVTVEGAVTGGGQAWIDGGATLDFRAAADAHVDFAKGAGTLELDDAFHFTGDLAGFGVDDVLDVAGLDSATASAHYANGVLTVTDGAQTLSLTLQGVYEDAFKVGVDHDGTVLVTYDPHQLIG